MNKTKAELLSEMEKLQSEVNLLKGRLEDSLLLVVNTLERATSEVAHHLRTLRIEDDVPPGGDEGWD